MKIIGLTGGIGSGKTTVANFFKELGIPVYIADDAGKKLMAKSNKVKSEIITLFGENAYVDANLNRKFIADQVFEDSKKLESLNKIIHPAVAMDFKNWLEDQKSTYIIYEAAILFESGGYKKCDLILLVTASKTERLKRLQKRDQSSIPEIEARMQHQWRDEEKRKLADYEIINVNLATTKAEVRNLHGIFLNTIKN